MEANSGGVESVRKDKEQDKQETEKLPQTGQNVSQCTGAAQLERWHINMG